MRKIIILMLISMVLTSCTQGQTVTSLSDTTSEEINTSALENSSLFNTSNEPVINNSSKMSFANNELLEQLKKGVVSNLKLDEKAPDIEFFKEICNNSQNEWIQYDINGDGFDDLILQETNDYGTGAKSIIAIFSAETGELVCHLLDVSDVTEFFFLADNNNLIYYYDEHYTYDVYIYRYIVINQEWNREWIYDLHIYRVTDAGESNDEWWQEHHSDITGKGVYSYKLIPYNLEDGDDSYKEARLSKQQFLNDFKETIGVDFEEMEPRLFHAWSNE